ncbi:Kinesin-associated protein 3 [Rhizoclosmatium sp. JEL0117]|nr:Kinesin-associated protein 3 [Rhizoclosmatium sp. JEL0117]
MAEESAKRKITFVSTEVHPNESAIVVNYYLQLISVSDNGKQTPGERKAMQKSIKVRVSEDSDITAIAREIIEKYPKLIPAIKMRDLESSLIQLQSRGGSIPDVRAKSRNDDEVGAMAMNASNMLESYTRNRISSGKEENASLDMIEQYIEGLYEDMPDKIASTRNILSLAKNPQNLDILMDNESLISAISRVLREDNKKSMELVTNIIYIFFCFSNFPQYHPFITANKVGDMCLRITDQELNRFNLWSTDLQKLETKCIQSPNNEALNRDLEKEHRKFQAMIRKQDQLLFVCFHLLLNLAEDLSIEVKMVRRDIVRYLMTILDRETPELLVLTMTFLKKLSIFKENKDELVQSDSTFTKLEKILCIENAPVQGLALKLLLNLSHDKAFRTTMIRNGCLSKIVDLLSSKTHVILTLQLLYQLSIDDANRDLMTVDGVVPLVLKMVLEYKGEKVNTELMAVAINLATSRRNAEVMVDDSGLKFLVRRVLKTKDVLILKMLRNISMHEGDIKFMFLDYIDELMILLLKNVSNPDVFVEVMGIVGNLTIPDFDFAKLAQAYGLVDLVQKKLASAVAAASEQRSKHEKKRSKRGDRDRDEDDEEEGRNWEGLMENDDITLEAIILLGTMLHDENIAPMVAKTETIQLLMDLMIIKEEDDEIVLQIIYCIYHFLLYDSTRQILISKTQVVSYLIDLLYDRNHAIRKLCDTCLDIISEINEDWIKKIKHQKFQWHNSEYLSVMAELLVEQEAAAAAAAAHQRGTKNGGGKGGVRGDVGGRKVALGGNTYYSGLDETDSSEEEEFVRQIGGTSAILDGP